MNQYTITFSTDEPESYDYDITETWSGYDEKTAIAQCMLHHAYRGARKIEVLEITQK